MAELEDGSAMVSMSLSKSYGCLEGPASPSMPTIVLLLLRCYRVAGHTVE